MSNVSEVIALAALFYSPVDFTDASDMHHSDACLFTDASDMHHSDACLMHR